MMRLSHTRAKGGQQLQGKRPSNLWSIVPSACVYSGTQLDTFAAEEPRRGGLTV